VFGADDVVDAFHLLPHWLRFATVAAGGATAGLVVRVASRHKGETATSRSTGSSTDRSADKKNLAAGEHDRRSAFLIPGQIAHEPLTAAAFGRSRNRAARGGVGWRFAVTVRQGTTLTQ